jgi:hypothetical protein
MQKFVRKSSIWAVIGCLFAFSIEWLASQEMNDYNRKANVLQSQKMDTLILGSSHSYYGVKAGLAGSTGTYNLSWSSQTLDESAWLLSRIPENTHTLICVSPFSLATTVNDREEMWRNVYFNRNFDWLSSDPKELSFWFSTGGRKTLKMARNVVGKVRPSRIDDFGNGEQNGTNSNLPETAGAACKRHFRKPLSQQLKRILIELSRRPNIRFFTPPFHESYLACIEDKQLWNETLILLDSLSGTNSINYTNYSKLPLPDSCFYDADHLNSTGSIVFSKILFGQEN